MFNFNDNEHETVEEMNESVLSGLLNSDGSSELLAHITDWLTDNNDKTLAERSRFVAKYVGYGVPVALSIIKGLGFMGVFLWLPTF